MKVLFDIKYGMIMYAILHNKPQKINYHNYDLDCFINLYASRS